MKKPNKSIVRRTIELFSLASIASACIGNDVQESTSVAVQRDSAGVAIVAINSDPWSAPVWAIVDTVNVVRIRPVDSVPATFFRRLGWADVLSDGSVVALDWQSGEVNVFGPDGAFVRRIGRTGQGPGEFELPVMVKTGPGDSIHVINPDQRIDVFSKEGQYARRLRIGNYEPLTALADGSYLASRSFDYELQAGKMPDSATIFRLTPEGDTTQVVARYLRGETTYHSSGRSFERALQLFRPARFAHGTALGFVWCDAADFICDEWSAEGKKIRSLRIRVPQIAVTDADINAWRAVRIARYKTKKAIDDFERSIAQADRAATFPFYSLYRVDDKDRIWFREYVRNDDKTSNRWTVVTLDGKVLGTVSLPAMQKLLKITSSLIVVIERDADDQESLTLFRYSLAKQ